MADAENEGVPDADDVYRALDDHPAPFLATGEIESGLDRDISRPTLLDRLNSLESEGRIAKRKVGGNTLVWYDPEQLNRRLSEYADGEPPEETREREEETPVADGGINAGLPVELYERGLVSPTKEREYDVVNQMGEHLFRALVSSVILILATSAGVVFGLPTALQIGLGLVFWYALYSILAAGWYGLLLKTGHYRNDTRTEYGDAVGE